MRDDPGPLLGLIEDLEREDKRFFIRIRPALSVGRLELELWVEDENGDMVGVADEIGRDANLAAAGAWDRLAQWRARSAARMGAE